MMFKRYFKHLTVFIGVMMLAALLALPALAEEARKPGDYAKEQVKNTWPAVKAVNLEDAKKMLEEGGWQFLDVRTADEFKKGNIPNSINVPRGLLEFQVENKIPDYNTKILVYCKSGGRACLSGKALMDMGYKNVAVLNPGFDEWVKVGYPVSD